MTTLAPSAAPVSEALSGNESPDVRGASRPSRWRIPISDLRDALVRPPRGYVGAMDVVDFSSTSTLDVSSMTSRSQSRGSRYPAESRRHKVRAVRS